MLGLLADASVAKHLGQAVLSGQERPPQVALRRAAEPLGGAHRWRTEPVRVLVDEAMRRFEDQRTAADSWFAPRLHATLRMTRAEAADGRLWNFIAMVVAPDYVAWRHRGSSTGGGPGSATAARFCGPHYTQAFSRLWWAAELFRDGPDYRPIETACRVQDVLQTTMRLDVIDHRPTAQAILHMVERQLAEGVPRLGDQVNALSSAVNAAGSTLVYDVLAPDRQADTDALQDWIDEAEDAAAAPWDRLPEGPRDGEVSRASVDALLPIFEQLLAEAPLRDRSAGEKKVPAARVSAGVSLAKPSDRL
ncbi:DUF6339 family protein [Streptomyces sp. NBC_01294]|uniref:DUF6339 family protein n=1 Tax=Streptomyces sp. NBC_01294 TaxID=2903815 RepID=UPI002DD9CC0D|nr:DUF6339 family protein [Streptomyces sp. NBC_01294]WRZ59132.1 DUF6339 family protein [Streptomyces sp. NBC_01294]